MYLEGLQHRLIFSPSGEMLADSFAQVVPASLSSEEAIL